MQENFMHLSVLAKSSESDKHRRSHCKSHAEKLAFWCWASLSLASLPLHELLTEHGVALAQGYLRSRPSPKALGECLACFRLSWVISGNDNQAIIMALRCLSPKYRFRILQVDLALRAGYFHYRIKQEQLCSLSLKAAGQTQVCCQ